jgi:hypothetical protein
MRKASFRAAADPVVEEETDYLAMSRMRKRGEGVACIGNHNLNFFLGIAFLLTAVGGASQRWPFGSVLFGV